MTVLSLLGTILAISALIVVHEAGHYFVAKWCKMRVDRFSLGFGPGILRWQRKETTFQIAPIPFGGFVEIRGMTIAEEVDPDDVFAYPNRPVWQRILTIFAGPATNYLFAIVLAFVLYATSGMRTGTAWYVVDEIQEGSTVGDALVPGDRILSIQRKRDAQPLPIYFEYGGVRQTELSDYINEAGPTELRVTVERGGEQVTVAVTPKLFEAQKETETDGYRLGIGLRAYDERRDVGLIGSIGHALYYPVFQTVRYVSLLRKIASGEEEGGFIGPVGIGQVVKGAIETGWITTLTLLMALNVMLGLINLFPLPALDGGRLVFLGYEMATRRRANPKIEATVHMVGILFLLVLMVVVTYNDCARLL